MSDLSRLISQLKKHAISVSGTAKIHFKIENIELLATVRKIWLNSKRMVQNH